MFTIIVVSAFFAGYHISSSGLCLAFCEPAESSVNATRFSEKMNGENTIVIDIRTKEEFESGHIPGAENIDFYQTAQFSAYLDGLDKTKRYLIYCKSGNRSNQAYEIMKEKGFLNVTELQGGILSWQASNLPIAR